MFTSPSQSSFLFLLRRKRKRRYIKVLGCSIAIGKTALLEKYSKGEHVLDLVADHAYTPTDTKPVDHPATILILDDDFQVRHIVRTLLCAEYPGLNIISVATSSEALAHAAIMRPRLLIVDYHLFGSVFNGLQVFDELHRNLSLTPIPTIMVSSDLPVEAIKKRGIIGIGKPFDIDVFLEKVQNILMQTV